MHDLMQQVAITLRGEIHLVLGSILALVLALITADYIRVLALRAKLPPGPLPWPIVGNTFQLPAEKPWIWFEKLSQDYQCEIVTCWIGRRHTLWINDAWVADELLNKRAGIYSSRPTMTVFIDHGTGSNNLIAKQYGARWRELRKITHHGVGQQQIRNYRDFQNNESKQIPWDILQDPEEFVNHFERYAASTVSIIGFGRRLQSYKDPIVAEVISVMHRAAAMNVPAKSGVMLLDTFPYVSKLPGPWKKMTNGMTIGHKFFLRLAKEAHKENPNENHSRDLYENFVDKYQLTDQEVSGIASNLFGAGSDTSSSTLITFVLACVSHPEVLQKAWDELDRVVGFERSPTFEDQPNLPYIDAFMREVFRWRTVAILAGMPHSNVVDDVWNGYLIPANSWIQASAYAIHHHPREFPEPDRFNPDRFLKENRRPYPNSEGYNAFGYGRRTCAGKALAEQGTYISIARMLWAFNITKALDADGKPIDVDIFAYTNGSNVRPQLFPARFLVRNDTIKATIEREAKEGLRDLERYNTPTKYSLFTTDATDDSGNVKFI